MSEPRHIYHYSTTRITSSGHTETIDGIATLASKIESQEHYHELKKVINPNHWKPMAILSLSYHGKGKNHDD
jgi:hypothetical protein